jgi:fatty acid desaturase
MKLRYAADARSLVFVGIYFALVTTLWSAGDSFAGVVIVPELPAWLTVGLFVLTCVFSFIGAVITHNTVHAPVFEGRTANRFFQVVLSLTYGSPVSSFVPGHNLSHHKYPQTARDVMRTTKVRSTWNLPNMLLFVPRVAWAIMRNDAVYTARMKGTHRAWFRQYRLENSIVWGITAVLLILDWQKTLMYWVVPHLYAAWGIIAMNYLQHDGADINHPYNHSRNFVGKALNFWTCNNGYHGIHHQTPGLHWSLLPEAHARLYAPHIDPRLDQRSLLVYLFRTFAWPGRRVTFDGRPVVLPPEGPDENWIPHPSETPHELGAGA